VCPAGCVTPRSPAGTVPPVGDCVSKRTMSEHEKEVLVERGDTLYSLGRKAGLSVPELLALNPGVHPSKLLVGQTVRVSAAKGDEETSLVEVEPLSPPERVAVTVDRPSAHEVSHGETFFSIGKQHGVPVDELKRANPGVAGQALSPGVVLELPEPFLASGWRPCLLGDYDAGVTDVGHSRPWPVGWRTPSGSSSSLQFKSLTGIRLALGLDYFGGARIGKEIGIRGPNNRRAPIPGHSRLSLDDHRQRLGPVLAALRFVESSNRVPCPDGDAGRSIGPFQIGLKYYADAWAVELEGKNAVEVNAAYQRARDLHHAEDTLLMYLLRYVPYAVHYQDWETLSRCHNGGPNFKNLRKTDRYWWKTRRTMKHGFGAHLRPNKLRLHAFGGDDVRELHAAHCRPPLAPLPEPDIDAKPLNPAWLAYGASTLVPHRDVLGGNATPGKKNTQGLRGLMARVSAARDQGATPRAFADLALDFAREELEVPEDDAVEGVLLSNDPWPPRPTRWPPGARLGPTALVLSGPWNPFGALKDGLGAPGAKSARDRALMKPVKVAVKAVGAVGRAVGTLVLPAKSSLPRRPVAKKPSPAPLVEHDNRRRPMERKRRQFLMDCGLW